MKSDPSQVYEVRCEPCQSSFAPGTRHCVHCGRKLGRRSARIRIEQPGQVEVELEGAEPEEIERRGALGSIFTTVMVGLAILASLYRSCP